MQYRMYCLSERHLSIAQKTIQAAHAIVEYTLKYGESDEYKQWAETDKTIIVLDGGNTPDMIADITKLSAAKVNYEIFSEPDMGNFVTSIAFIADERVWDYETTGKDYEDYCKLRTDPFRNGLTHTDQRTGMSMICDIHIVRPTYEQWCEVLGGESQAVLKGIISSKRLAQ